MDVFIKKHKWKILFTVIGAVGGFLYYIKVGCATGSCPLQSNPYLATLWGAVIGYLVGDMIKPKKKEETN